MALAASGSFISTGFGTKSRSSDGIPRGSRLAARSSPLKLDKPERLWETGSLTWFHGAEPPAYLDGSLRVFVLPLHQRTILLQPRTGV